MDQKELPFATVHTSSINGESRIRALGVKSIEPEPSIQLLGAYAAAVLDPNDLKAPIPLLPSRLRSEFEFHVSSIGYMRSIVC